MPPKYKYNCVLLIDDNEIDNFINEKIITASYFAEKVVVKDSAEGALDYIREECVSVDACPDIIFLDLSMPVMDGFEFLEKYKSIADSVKSLSEKCRIIVLSSSISPDDIDKASRNPLVYKYLNKPLNDKYLEAINF